MHFPGRVFRRIDDPGDGGEPPNAHAGSSPAHAADADLLDAYAVSRTTADTPNP
jgi:hypothetical protein